MREVAAQELVQMFADENGAVNFDEIARYIEEVKSGAIKIPSDDTASISQLTLDDIRKAITDLGMKTKAAKATKIDLQKDRITELHHDVPPSPQAIPVRQQPPQAPTMPKPPSAPTASKPPSAPSQPPAKSGQDLRHNTALDNLFGEPVMGPLPPSGDKDLRRNTLLDELFGEVTPEKRKATQAKIPVITPEMEEEPASTKKTKSIQENSKQPNPGMENAGPLLLALQTLTQRLASLEGKIHQQNEFSRQHGVASELGGGITGFTQRDALEAAKHRTPNWEQLSQADQKARVIEEYAYTKAQTREMTPMQRKLFSLERQGADPDITSGSMAQLKQLEQLEAKDRLGKAEKDHKDSRRSMTWGVLQAFQHVTGIPTLSRLYQAYTGWQDRTERLGETGAELEKARAAYTGGDGFPDIPPPSGSGGPGSGHAARTGAASNGGAPTVDVYDGLADDMAGGGPDIPATPLPGGGVAGDLAAGGGQALLQELLLAIKELSAAVKAGAQGSVSGGSPRVPGPQPDGTFIPGGPQPMAGRGTQSIEGATGEGEQSMPFMREGEGADPGMDAVGRSTAAGR